MAAAAALGTGSSSSEAGAGAAAWRRSREFLWSREPALASSSHVLEHWTWTAENDASGWMDRGWVRIVKRLNHSDFFYGKFEMNLESPNSQQIKDQ
jgi:hypothetical protein